MQRGEGRTGFMVGQNLNYDCARFTKVRKRATLMKFKGLLGYHKTACGILYFNIHICLYGSICKLLILLCIFKIYAIIYSII